MIKSRAASVEAFADCAQQYIVAEWFYEEIDCSRLHSSYGCWNISATGNKDDRHFGALLRDGPLQFEAVEVGECEIKDETTRDERARSSEKFTSRLEGFRLPTLAPNQSFQRFPNGDVIVHDEDNRRDARNRRMHHSMGKCLR